jgi:Abnormal spindle-like microcephaly-assoc'd, ASPM-SPD-2-Hydin
MQLRGIPFSAPFGCDPAAAYAARCDSSWANRKAAHSISCAMRSKLQPAFLIFLAFSFCLPIVLSGCGGASFVLNSGASGSLQPSPATVTFGAVPYGQTASSSVALVNQRTEAVQVSQINVTGQAFSASLTNNLPITVPAGGTYSFNVNFSPAGMGAATGQVTITSNSPDDTSLAIGLNGTGTAASSASTSTSLSVLSCANESMTGAGIDSCTAMLTGPAPSGGLVVSLTSNDPVVVVPPTVTVQPGETSAVFTVSVAAVGTAQTATLTAAAGGASDTFALQLGAVPATLSTSSSFLAFGNVNLNTVAQQTLSVTATGNSSVTISAATAVGPGFTVSGQSLPFILNPNQTANLIVQFDPSVAGPATGQIILTSSASTGPSTVIDLSGTGEPVLSGLSCAIGSISGTGSDNCTVTLDAVAPSGGLTVSLASNNSAVTVPASVSVPENANSASFTATVSSVGAAQTAMLTATANGISETFPLQLNTVPAGLSINATSIAFGNVQVNSSMTQSVELTASGPLSIAITAATVQGAGFSISGATFPLTLLDGQATVEVSLDPTAPGAATGQLVILSTSLTGGATTISLSGTGVLEEVNLNWDAPSSSADPIAGYNIYRAPDGSNSYQQLNGSTLNQTTYVDTTVQAGETYDYIVESVDAAGVTSIPSNMASATLP